MLVLGLGLLITLQALTNMMVSTDLAPSTGLTLPLVSQGGSSELFMSLALGMMLGVSRQVEQQTLTKPREESLLETPTRTVRKK
jgi:cell division protein FtsW